MLEEYINKDLLTLAGFNEEIKPIKYYRHPFTRFVYANNNCPKSGHSYLNIIVIEEFKRIRKKGLDEVRWYFGTYERNSVIDGPGNYIPEFRSHLRKFWNKKYRINPSELEQKLEESLKEFSKKHISKD